MRNKLWSFFILMSLSVLWATYANASGRLRMPDNHPWSGSVALNAWSRDQHVNIALCNLAHETRTFKIAVGTYAKTETLYASTTQMIPGKSIELFVFPIVRQETDQGDLKTAETVFVFADNGSIQGLVARQPIQFVKVGDRYSELTHFLLEKGNQAVYRYSAAASATKTIALIPNSMSTDQYAVAVSPFSKRTLMDLNADEIHKMGFSATYEKEIMKRSAANYPFLLSKDNAGSVAVVLQVEKISGCALVTISNYTYELFEDGSLIAGGGQGLTMMIYDPLAIAIQSNVQLLDPAVGVKKSKAHQP